MAPGYVLILLVFISGAASQIVDPYAGMDLCQSGFERHGSSCYRYINMAVSWSDAYVYCGTMFSNIVAIETQEENSYLTELVKNHTQGATDSLAERIWTGASNIQGPLLWLPKTPVTYTSWHVGEPYVTASDEVYCVMKAVDGWYSDHCSHDRKFVCEKTIDGIAIPDHFSGQTDTGGKTDQSTGKPNDILG